MNKLIIGALLITVAVLLICGAAGAEEHTDHEGWTGISSLSEITQSGSYYLTSSIDLNSCWNMPSKITVKLCLNGYVIHQTAELDTLISIPDGSTLHLLDCNATDQKHYFTIRLINNILEWVWEDNHRTDAVPLSEITNSAQLCADTVIEVTGGCITGNQQHHGYGVYVGQGGTFHLSSGNIIGITGHRQNDKDTGGGVCVDGGTFTMDGGNIAGNRAQNGGGVYVACGAFTMTGGNIIGNTAVGGGGGVYVNKDSTFTTNNGKFIGNSAKNGGSVYVAGGTSEMKTGTAITGNSAEYGGGVYVANTGTFTMDGGSVDNNKADDGAGVYINNGTFILKNGSVSYNSCFPNKFSGGGVYVNKNGQLKIVDGSIEDNRAEYGGGVFCWGKFEMSGGVIGSNSANNDGGGVFVKDDGRFFMKGGIINKNDTLDDGGGVYMDSDAKIYVQGNSVIKGNTYNNKEANNLYLNKYYCFHLEGPLTGNSEIYITEPDEGEFGRCVNGYIPTISDLNRIKTDDDQPASSNSIYEGGTDPQRLALSFEDGWIVTFNWSYKGKPNDQSIVDGGHAVKPLNPESDPYDFDGWYKEADWRNRWDFAHDTITGKTTLYGKENIREHPLFTYNNTTFTTKTITSSAESPFSGNKAAYNPQTNTLILNQDITCGGQLQIEPAGGISTREFIIDLNGHVLNFTGVQDKSAVVVKCGADLAIQDSNTAVKHYFEYDNEKGMYVLATENQELEVAGGCITGITTTGNGGGVTVNAGGSFTLNSGNIVGNKAAKGGGVYVETGGTFQQNGGSVTGNCVTGDGGGVYVKDGTFKQYYGSVRSNKAGGDGGGIYNTGNTEVFWGVVTLNEAVKSGGGIYNNNGKVTLNANSTVIQNMSARSGGGVYSDGSNAMLKLSGMVFDNRAAENGGGVYVNAGKFYMDDEAISANTAKENGGGVYIGSGSSMMMSGKAVIRGNNAEKGGGGVFSQGSFVMSDGSSISGNTADNEGGGVYIFGAGTFTFTGGTIELNRAKDGGGVYSSGDQFLLSDAGIIQQNTAEQNGGGIYIDTYGKLSMTNGTICANTAVDGGGVYNAGSFIMQSSSVTSAGTISENTATENGGGVYTTGSLTISAGTVSRNTAEGLGTNDTGSGGGVFVANGGEFVFTGGQITENSVLRLSNSGGGVFIYDGGTCTMSGGSITKNKAGYGGGVGIFKNGRFTLENGVIGGSSDKANNAVYGGGIYAENGTLTMTGGAISNNHASANGGGVVFYNEDPTSEYIFTMSGGRIAENTVNSHYKGVAIGCSDDAREKTLFKMSGSASIPESDDLYLSNGLFITIERPFTEAEAGAFNIRFDVTMPDGRVVASAGDEAGAQDALAHFGINKTFYPPEKYELICDPSASHHIIVSDKNKVTVTFNSNGGSPVPPQRVISGEKAVKPGDPYQSGKVFAGWFTDQDLTNLYDFNTPVTEDITLYAKWVNEGSPIEVMFHANGGMFNGDPLKTEVTITCKTGKPYSTYFPTSSVSRKGYNFDGWYTAAEGGDKIDGQSLITEEATPLYAHWTPIHYTINFDAGGGEGSMDPMTGVAYDTTATLKENTFSKTGHTFSGWSAPGILKLIPDKAQVPNLTTEDGAYVTLTAVWAGDIKTVTFYKDPDVVHRTAQVSYGSPLNKPSDPEKRGYEFDGWYTHPDGGEKWKFAGEEGAGTVTENLSLYAHWIPCKYTISFEGNKPSSASGEVENLPASITDVLYESTVDKPVDPTLTGYTFDGWFTDASCSAGEEFIFNGDAQGRPATKVTGDTILYAKWTVKSLYTVRYSYTGTVPSGAPRLPSSADYTSGDSVSVASAPSLPGYTFSGWSSSDVTISGGTFTMPSKNVTLKGSWTADPVTTYTVSYSYTGTVPSGAPRLPSSADYAPGDSVSVASAPSLPGYTFSGWSSSDVTIRDGTFTMPSKNVRLSGNWTESPVGYTITYNANGASGTVPAKETYIAGGDPLTISGPGDLRMDNARFLIWNTRADGTGESYPAGEEQITPDKDITLYARWCEAQSATEEIIVINENVSTHAAEQEGITTTLKTVAVPPGAVRDGVSLIQIEAISSKETAKEIPFDENRDTILTVLEISLLDDNGNKVYEVSDGITVSFLLTLPDEVPEGVMVMHYNGSVWEPVDCIWEETAVPGVYRISFTTTSFSPFTVLKKPTSTIRTVFDPEMGTVDAARCAYDGANVTVTAVPEKGYRVKSVSVVKDAGGAVSCEKTVAGTYVFTMPGEPVTIQAEFAKNSSHSSDTSDPGTSIWLTATPTPTPTPVPGYEIPTVKPTEKETPTETPGAKTPVPVAGVIAGLGTAAVLFGLRRK